MLANVFNEIIKKYLARRYRRRVQPILDNSTDLQEALLKKIITSASSTAFAKERGISSSSTMKDFKNLIALSDYENLYPYIQRMMMGESDVLVTGNVKWFAKSSGTTNDRSKYIPITNQYLYENLICSSWDTTSIIYKNRPASKIFSGKNLIMGGSLTYYDENPKVIIGDISAIMIYNIPPIGRPFYTPTLETALLSDWNLKIDNIIKECLNQNVVMFGGVPTWNIVLFNRILEYTGKSNMLEIWPELKTYLHGGVSFTPYIEQFKNLIPTADFDYIEVYNASEGYFAVQDTQNASDEGMLLLTNNGIYFEFVSLQKYNAGSRDTECLHEVKIGENYVIVITTTSGLWRYIPGDTVIFLSKNPFRIKVTGRTKQFINVFGEEVMVSNTDMALEKTCKMHCCTVSEYSVGPVYLKNSTKGGHEWLIEFETPPKNLWLFQEDLDRSLRAINSDYDAKRSDNLALVNLIVSPIKPGCFHQWLAFKGKLGGQYKVPRLSNDRRYIDEIKSFVK